jgi:hypothetical protein
MAIMISFQFGDVPECLATYPGGIAAVEQGGLGTGSTALVHKFHMKTSNGKLVVKQQSYSAMEL